jgi:aspartate/tyrosine/aromatic aminotransferase
LGETEIKKKWNEEVVMMIMMITSVREKMLGGKKKGT